MNLNKIKKILAISAVSCLLAFAISSSASAAFEYKMLEGLPGFYQKDTTAPDLPDLIVSIYKFGIWTVGIAGLLMMTVGGVMYMGSAGNNAAAQSAKKIITDSLIGIVAALTAYLFMYVINPDLVNVNLGNLISVEVDTFELPASERVAPVAGSSTAGTGGVPALYQCASGVAAIDYSNGGKCKEKSGKLSSICSSGCGVVSTAMVLKYYGKDADIKGLSQKVIAKGGRICNAGSTAAGLAAAAESYGLKSQATTAENALAKAGSNKPVVISVRECKSGKDCRFTNGGHFIVVTSRDGDNLTINDPSNGAGKSTRKQITVSELKSECCLGQGITFN